MTTYALIGLTLFSFFRPAAADVAVIDFTASGHPISPWLASANVNNVHYKEEQDNPQTRAAIAGLGMNFLRFQSHATRLDEFPPDGKPGEYILDRRGREWVDACLQTARNWRIDHVMLCPGASPILTVDDNGEAQLLPREDWPRVVDAMVEAVRLFGPTEQRPGVEYWELFNEPRAWLEDREALGELVGRCARAMKRANPRIKVGGPAWSWFSLGNLASFLDGAGDSIDFLSWHRYGAGSVETPDEKLLSATPTFAEQVRALSEELQRRGIRDRLKLFISEYHINYHAWDPWDARVATNFGAVWTASVLGHLAYTDVDAACIHDVRIAAYGLVGWRDESVEWRPIADTYWLYNQYFRGEAVPVAFDGEDEMLEVFAARGEGHSAVFIVNKASRPRDIEVQIAGLPGPPQPHPVLVVTRDEEGIRARRAQWPAHRPAEIRTEVPPRSLTVWILPSVAPAIAPPSITQGWSSRVPG